MLSALDPLGLPVATQVLSWERADDLLYIPAIKQMSASLHEHGLLYVGDCKMAALETREYLEAQQNYYLYPLANKQMPDAVLDEYLQSVWAGTQLLTAVTREREARQPEVIAEGYEQTVTGNFQVKGKTINWTERHLIVRSIQLAEAAAQAILKEHRVDGLLRVTIEEQVAERWVRAYGNRSAGVWVERALSVRAEVDASAVEEAIRWLGWRVYATNQPKEVLPLAQAVLAYLYWLLETSVRK
jgi:transposase